MVVVQISLLIVTFLSLISCIFVSNANHQRSQPTPSHSAMFQYVQCHLLILIILLLFMPLVECWCMAYATLPGKVKWSAPHHTIKMMYFVLFLSVTCYNSSMLSCIHVNTTKLYNITCTLVATGVILWSLKCSSVRSLMWTVRIYPWSSNLV